uniref:Arginyl-tRNA--protein transferase 1 n=1 Tax=Trichuris muris TaxID=70415 RepID=A0A5S6QI15_TRIMR
MWLHHLTPSDYQALIDRGWRRSGLYCYKPVLETSCCPAYTIRCHALDFKPSKSQKRVMKRFANFLKTGDIPKASARSFPPCSSKKQASLPYGQSSMIHTASSSRKGSSSGTVIASSARVEEDKAKCVASQKKPLELLLRKGKYKRRMRKMEKLKAKGIDPALWVKKVPPVKSVEDFLGMANGEPSWKHKLTVRLICASPLYKEFQTTFDDSFRLYRKYQMLIHRDDCENVTEGQFKRFLCKSPFLVEEVDHADHPGFGTFHYQFYLDGRLVAVSVLDLLPACVSSKYFYYDPDFHFLSLGVYSALKEIELTRKLSRITPSVRFYYMGYYIHSCAKMRYKGAFRPSDLLCPETFDWFPIEDCIGMLEKGKQYRFAPDNVPANSEPVSLNDALVFYKGRNDDFKFVRFGRYRLENKVDGHLLSKLSEYACLVGKSVAESMAIVL